MGATADRANWPDRLVELGLVGLIFIGSLILVGIPIAWLWLISHLDLAYTEVYLLSLLGCPIVMIAWGTGLMRLNRLYLEVSGGQSRPVLEASITLAALLAIGGLVAWLLLLAGSGGPMQGPWPG
jgi:hypothetical protein